MKRYTATLWRLAKWSRALQEARCFTAIVSIRSTCLDLHEPLRQVQDTVPSYRYFYWPCCCCTVYYRYIPVLVRIVLGVLVELVQPIQDVPIVRAVLQETIQDVPIVGSVLQETFFFYVDLHDGVQYWVYGTTRKKRYLSKRKKVKTGSLNSGFLARESE
jgi:hypothetical protein